MRIKSASKHSTDSRENRSPIGTSQSGQVIDERDREFVLDSIAAFAESHLAVLHETLGEDRRLYLITGEVFQLRDSGITRLH
jgi:hypothetical protein